ncbi:MAG: hypothetical protein RLZZ628_3916 [Bacteroidota bacterium]|jgi:tetratricopeptide (TPR) repeat protein
MRMKKLQQILKSVQNRIANWNLDETHRKTIQKSLKDYLDGLEEHHVTEIERLLQKEVAEPTQQTALKNIIRQSFLKAGNDIHIGDTIHQTVYIQFGAVETPVNRYLSYGFEHQLPNQFFLKRPLLLADLRNRLREHLQVVVTGQAGIGKTVLAQLYIQEYGLEYDFIAWIPISTHWIDALVAGFKSSPDLMREMNGISEHAKHLKLSESEHRYRLARHILAYCAGLAGRKLFIWEGVTAAKALLESNWEWAKIPDSHFLITAETADGFSFSVYDCPPFDRAEIEAFAQAFGAKAGWNRDVLQQLAAQNKELLEWTLRVAPQAQPKKLQLYLDTVHKGLASRWESTDWVRWLVQQNDFSAEHLWVLSQAAVLPRALSVDLWCPVLGLAHRDSFRNENVYYSPDFHFFKHHADGNRYRNEPQRFKFLSAILQDLAAKGWMREQGKSAKTYSMSAFLKKNWVKIYGIEWYYVAEQAKSLELNFFLQAEVGYEPETLNVKAQLIFEEHLARFLKGVKMQNVEAYRSLLSKQIVVLKTDYYQNLEAIGNGLDELLDLQEEALGEDYPITCDTRYELAEYYFDKKLYDKAMLSYQYNLSIWKSLRHRQNEAATLDWIGTIHVKKGEKDAAMCAFEDSLNIVREIKYRQGEADILYAIGKLYASNGENDAAMCALEESLKIAREIKYRQVEAVTLHVIGKLYASNGKKEVAMRAFEESLKINREIKNRQGEAVILNEIGKLYASNGENDAAMCAFKDSLNIARGIKNRQGEAVTLHEIGKLYASNEEKDAAMDALEKSLKIEREIKNREGEAVTLHEIGKLYASNGENDAAMCAFEDSLEIEREIKNRQGEAVILHEIGKLYASNGEKDAAMCALEESLEIERKIKNRQGEAIILYEIGKLYASNGEKEATMRALEESLKILREIGDKEIETIVLKSIEKLKS